MTKDGVLTTYICDLNNRLTSEVTAGVTTTYGYDNGGNQISKTVGAGTPQTDTFDLFGRLTAAGGATYTYGPDDLRRTKTISGTTTQFVWNGQNMVADVVSGAVQTRYLYGVNLISSIAGATTKFYLYNAHGDVVQLASSAGTVTKTYHYDAFGNEVSPDSADTNPFRYNGQYYDKETGTYYLRARYYNPAIGRFISQDGMEYIKDKDPLTLNLYTYCNNSPIIFTDPDGHFINFIIGAVVGGLIGGAMTAVTSYMETGSIDWGSVAISTAVGAASGLVAATGIGLLAQAGISAGISCGGSIAGQLQSKGKINPWEVVGDTALGFATSAAGSFVGKQATKSLAETAVKNISKGANKIVTGEQSLLNSRYGKGAIKVGTKLLNQGIKQLNIVKGKNSVIGTALGVFPSIGKEIAKASKKGR